MMTAKMEVFEGIIDFPLLELGISQMYLNEKKIRAVEEWFDPYNLSNLDPMPVHDFGNGKYTLTDGHSRAYIAYKYGLTHVPIIYDNDEIITNELGQMLHCMDIEWCERFHLKNVSDMNNRIIGNDEYMEIWVNRCKKSYNLLSQTTELEREIIRESVSGLYLYGASESLDELYFEDASGRAYTYYNIVMKIKVDEERYNETDKRERSNN